MAPTCSATRTTTAIWHTTTLTMTLTTTLTTTRLMTLTTTTVTLTTLTTERNHGNGSGLHGSGPSCVPDWSALLTLRVAVGSPRGGPMDVDESAEPLIAGYDGVVCDLDGVVYRGADAVHGAPEALQHMVARGIR